MRSGFLIAALCIAGAVADTELSNPKIARRAYNFEPLEKYRQLCVDQCFDALLLQAPLSLPWLSKYWPPA
ncbi:hypothetical protein MCOR26_009941 [Pyricularia oryzae]|nr:hypothetical protein MCOR26_009941 [Pyricularia oryzae]